MRIVALEEHFSCRRSTARPAGGPKLTVADDARPPSCATSWQDRRYREAGSPIRPQWHLGPSARRPAIISSERRACSTGTGPSRSARKFNDEFARKVAERPDHFAAFAHRLSFRRPPRTSLSGPCGILSRARRSAARSGVPFSTIRSLRRARAPKSSACPSTFTPHAPPMSARRITRALAPEINFGLATFAWGLALRGGAARHAPRTGGHHGTRSARTGSSATWEGPPAMLRGATTSFRPTCPISTAAVQDDHRSGLRDVAGFFTNPPFVRRWRRLERSVDVLRRLPLRQSRGTAARSSTLPSRRNPILAKFAHGNAERSLK